VRLYLIGAGVIARTHATAAAKLDEPVELHVADPSAAARAAFAAEHPAAAGYASAAEMLAAPARDDDIVIVATPPGFHHGTAVQALRSGRHVLCEKPLAMTADEATDLLRVAQEAGRMLGSCSTRYRTLPHNEAVKSVLASGVLGELLHLEFVTRFTRSRAGIEYQPGSRWFLDRSKSGGGVLMDLGPYDVSTLFDLLRPTRIEIRDAWLGRALTAADPADTVFDIETEVGAALRIHRADGTAIPVTYGRATGTQATERAHGELVGTTGSVRWTPFDSHAPVVLRRDVDGVVVEVEVPPPPRPDLEIFDRPLVFFHAAMRGRPSPAALGAAAVDEFLVLRAIDEVAATGVPAAVDIRATA
jgi:predicted dehydrogenase